VFYTANPGKLSITLHYITLENYL